MRARETGMMICGSYKSKMIASAQTLVYHISGISRSHIVIIWIICIFTHRTAVLGIYLYHRRDLFLILIPVDSPIIRRITDMMRNCNGMTTAALHQLFR